MALISEEVCVNCIWHRHDDEKTIWCCNPLSPDHMEDVAWSHSCKEWEAYDEPTMPEL